MKSPLWVINSILAIILVVLFAYIIYSLRTLFEQPKAASIKGIALSALDKKEEVKPQDLSLIYEEYDLFGTYRPSITQVKPLDSLPTIPALPERIPLQRKAKEAVQFLKPLPFKITGIIASNNEAKSQVSLFNTNSGKTESFNIGDKVQDAYILRIFPRKVVVVRSNGQQETIYLYSDDAKLDMARMQDTSWSDVIQQLNAREYLLNPTTFASRVHSLANLIDMADLTTASQHGKPVGVRIGWMKPNSIGFASGFLPGDIITKIHNRTPISTPERIEIFNEISALDLGSRIQVEFMRDGSVNTNTYTLFNLADDNATLEDTYKTAITSSTEKLAPFQMPPLPTEGIGKIQEMSPVKAMPKEQPQETTITAPQPIPPIKPQEPIISSNVQTSTRAQEVPTERTGQARSTVQDQKKRELDAMKKFGGKSASMAPQPGASS